MDEPERIIDDCDIKKIERELKEKKEDVKKLNQELRECKSQDFKYKNSQIGEKPIPYQKSLVIYFLTLFI